LASADILSRAAKLAVDIGLQGMAYCAFLPVIQAADGSRPLNGHLTQVLDQRVELY